MQSLPNIQQLIDENRLEEAATLLATHISDNPNDDEAWLLQGRLHWRMLKYSAALTDFETALSINPESDARHALELAQDIFNYYNPDLLNP